MGQEKKFNIHGICYPDRHYMVDLSGRLSAVKNMIDQGEYFVINRARQYGKTTLLRALKEYLRPEYAVISMSFQKMSTAKFRDEYAFSQAFVRDFLRKAEKGSKEQGLSEVCRTAQKRVVTALGMWQSRLMWI